MALVTISYDSSEILADFAQRHGITYTMLSDPDSATIKRYGILNTVVDEALGPNGDDPEVLADLEMYVTVTQAGERFRGIAYPGTFMLDPEGIVTARFFEDFYRERNTVANIMLRLGADRSFVQGTEISTAQIQIKTYPSDSVIALGERFALAVEITPLPNMHVYAPGAEKYRVVTLQIEPQPFVRLLPIRHPASEIYFFEPLNERVPVYQKPFTLLQEVVPESSRDARAAFQGKDTLTLTGSLEYQACDDRVCYNPMSVPLSWTVEIKPFVPRQARQPQ
ncbi:redoxin domain-containing protein [Acidobacteria bacterium AH-259-D05]|nr:redoxin domain-containing protein [Acidobacteria bacterium AH-259-D05]